MSRWMVATVAGFMVIYSVTVLLTSEPIFLLPVLLLGVLLLAYSLGNRLLTKRLVDKHGSLEAAMQSEDESIPATHLLADDETALGDTAEAHDEINPHDLPMDHPGRKAAEAQAGGEDGTTQGDADLLDVGPTRDEPGDPGR
jgi:hypothetical protein